MIINYSEVMILVLVFIVSVAFACIFIRHYTEDTVAIGFVLSCNKIEVKKKNGAIQFIDSIIQKGLTQEELDRIDDRYNIIVLIDDDKVLVKRNEPYVEGETIPLVKTTVYSNRIKRRIISVKYE